ncbi:MAG: glycogen debranching protein [Candidatus Epulonipiscium fishelsonii]|nr:MAG: glycogen debranching protein [Epulopiscium sp. AS2M-Bin002]
MKKVNYEFGAQYFRDMEYGNDREWLISNGLGGYSCSTILGGGNRVHHGYLVVALEPPSERILVFTRTQEQIQIGSNSYDLTSQSYITNPKTGHNYLKKFIFDGVPTYVYQIEDVEIKKTICMEYEHNTVVVCYEIKNGIDKASINVIPLFNYKKDEWFNHTSTIGLDVHLYDDILKLEPKHNQNLKIQFYKSEGEYVDRRLMPTLMTSPNYVYEDNHYYKYERDNGKSGLDSHFTPYEIRINLEPNETKKFYFKCTIEELNSKDGFDIIEEFKNRQEKLLDIAGYEEELAQKLVLSADNFISQRKSTNLKTILAGFPWFGDWGRDTMIAFNGITLATKRYTEAREILESFAMYVKNGLIPNLFSEHVGDLAYNTVDGSLWYFYAVDMYLNHTNDYSFVKEKLYHHLENIIQAYKNGTDFAIRMDTDGLIIAGDGSCQLTWMDAMIGDWVVTPRNGKPVEVNALWYNALCVMEKLSLHFKKDSTEYIALSDKVRKSFRETFWNEKNHCLYDVVDSSNEEIRCNQIWAVSLPYNMMSPEQEKQIVQIVYKKLYNIYGLRTLSPNDQKFVKEYIGSHYDRDASYHMGTTWVFPIGGFITAYCKVNNYSKEAILTAEEMCLIFLQHLNDGCINGIAELFDGDIANKGKGCFNQAWSVGEVLRAYTEDVLPHKN